MNLKPSTAVVPLWFHIVVFVFTLFGISLWVADLIFSDMVGILMEASIFWSIFEAYFILVIRSISKPTTLTT